MRGNITNLVELSFELKAELSYSPSLAKMASQTSHVQLAEVLSIEVEVSQLFLSVSLQ